MHSHVTVSNCPIADDCRRRAAADRLLSAAGGRRPDGDLVEARAHRRSAGGRGDAAAAAHPAGIRRAARDFASRELGLPDNDSYRSYADLGRPYVVWNVFAAPEFSVEPRRWCFPIAGCVVYRGYFSEDAAQRYASGCDGAATMRRSAGRGLFDGHFKDPVLNTMLGWSDAQLAATLFHELAHRVVYVPGDSEFNESFATVVEEAGLERWLAARQRGQDLVAWRPARAPGGVHRAAAERASKLRSCTNRLCRTTRSAAANNTSSAS